VSTSKIQGIKRDDQLADRRPEIAKEDASIDLSHFLGTWINTYRDTRSITRFALARASAGYTITAYVSDGVGDLGAVEVVPFAANVDSREADGFTARYDFGFLEMSLAAYYTKGLIVVSQYTRFKDESGRPDYFNREFFFKTDQR
jgi:hypothetical protein